MDGISTLIEMKVMLIELPYERHGTAVVKRIYGREARLRGQSWQAFLAPPLRSVFSNDGLSNIRVSSKEWQISECQWHVLHIDLLALGRPI
jgi:hypothetical protein